MSFTKSNALFKSKKMAGAEGLEPSTYGFGEAVQGVLFRHVRAHEVLIIK